MLLMIQNPVWLKSWVRFPLGGLEQFVYQTGLGCSKAGSLVMLSTG